MTISRVLLVGATGSIGRAAVAAAHEAGLTPRALVRDVGRTQRMLPTGTDLVVGDSPGPLEATSRVARPILRLPVHDRPPWLVRPRRPRRRAPHPLAGRHRRRRNRPRPARRRARACAADRHRDREDVRTVRSRRARAVGLVCAVRTARRRYRPRGRARPHPGTHERRTRPDTARRRSGARRRHPQPTTRSTGPGCRRAGRLVRQTTAQVILRRHIEHGLCTIPKSVKAHRVA
ncbi:hypothetical protein SAMN02787118_12215 [Streptomyces mirabilis]|uniref:NAD(P)H-binding n=1 Tax=Streptomyces mirabilis TaxID=68239 RepID=A0A1I2SGG6_9ACTN|nr:hypothetical protein SAMN02787118_12215 [Streptomyces mirabilis]